MMSCPEYASWISMLVDGELPPAQQPSVQGHLSRCPHCRDLHAAWELHGKACRGYFAQHALTEDFVAKVRIANRMASAARTNKEKGWLHNDLFAWLQAAAAFLAIALLLNQFFPWQARKAIGQVLNPGMRLELRASASANWQPAPAGIALHPGDWLRNTEQSKAEILIREASRLTLQGGTVAQLGSGTRDSRNQLRLWQGSLQSESVADARDLLVATPVGEVIGSGAKFEVGVSTLTVPSLEISDDRGEFLRASVVPVVTLSVEEGSVRVETEAASHEVNGGSTAHFTSAQFGLMPSVTRKQRNVIVELQVVSPPYVGSGLLGSSLAVVGGDLQMQIRAKEIPLRRLLELSTDSYVQGGDDLRVSGALTFPADTRAESIAAAIGDGLQVPISVADEEKICQTAILAETQKYADDKLKPEFSARRSRDGLLSYSFRNVPAAQAFRALSSANPEVPLVAPDSRLSSVTLDLTGVRPDRVFDQLREQSGFVLIESMHRIQVIRVGRRNVELESKVAASNTGDLGEPPHDNEEGTLKELNPLGVGVEFNGRHASLAGSPPSEEASAPVSADRTFGNGNSSQIRYPLGAAILAVDASQPNTSIMAGGLPRLGTGDSAKTAIVSSGQDSGPVKLTSSKHLIWPPVEAGQDDLIYTLMNFSYRRIRALWLGYNSDGRLTAQMEHVVEMQSITELNPAREWGIFLDEGGHWEVLSDAPLQMIESASNPESGIFAPRDAEPAHRNWEFELMRFDSGEAIRGLWVLNSGETMARVVVAVLAGDQVVISQQFHIAPHAGIRWLLEELSLQSPEYRRLPRNTLVLMSAMEGTVAAGIMSTPSTGISKNIDRGEWVH
jgi:hypothetical protein